MLVIKDYKEFTKLEDQRAKIEDIFAYSGDKEPLFRRLCVRKKNRTEEFLKEKIQKHDKEMEELLDSNFKSSCCAYVVFDSYNSMLA